MRGILVLVALIALAPAAAAQTSPEARVRFSAFPGSAEVAWGETATLDLKLALTAGGFVCVSEGELRVRLIAANATLDIGNATFVVGPGFYDANDSYQAETTLRATVEGGDATEARFTARLVTDLPPACFAGSFPASSDDVVVPLRVVGKPVEEPLLQFNASEKNATKKANASDYPYNWSERFNRTSPPLPVEAQGADTPGPALPLALAAISAAVAAARARKGMRAR